MTTSVSGIAYPFKTQDGRDLEVLVELIDTFEDGREDVLVSSQTYQNGDVIQTVSCWEGRKIVIQEVPKST